MTRRRLAAHLTLLLLAFSLLAPALQAQHSEPDSTATSAEAGPAAEHSAGDANAGVGEILHGAVERAIHSAEKWGAHLGLGPDTSFAVSLGFNFLAIVVFFYLLFKSKLPQMFRERTSAIQKGIREAAAASADASRRLSEIEARLARLDTEVSEIRASAEKEAAAEEARIRATSEEDQRKVIEAVETEISAIARNARRELKGYAASLAVELAARRIKLDESTDQALVRDFVDHLGKDGR